MAEFNFNCSQCGQTIRCDTGYAGSQINCPSCTRPIVVPSASGEGVIRIKTATLRNTALIALGMLLAAMVVVGGFYIFAGRHSVTFRGYVDGTDLVKIRGRSLWIEHQQWRLPVKMVINGSEWKPNWKGNTSSPHFLGLLTSPVNAGKVTLSMKRGRGDISIIEKPSPSNQETLTIKVDDGPFGGAAWYDFTVTW